MSETEIKNNFGDIAEQSSSFENPYVDRGTSKPKDESKKFITEESQFVTKGSNRKLDSSIKYDIHFQIGGGTFNNLITFLNDIHSDVAFLFRKKEAFFISIDISTTHCAVINFSKIEFSIYDVKGLEDNDSEKGVLIDISFIIEELSMRDEIPVDVYIDTLEKNRFYVISGKEIVERQLNSVNSADGVEALLQKYRNFGLRTMTNLINRPDYQKIVANQVPLLNLIKSLSKKTSKKKDDITLCNIYLTKHYIDFKIESDVKSSSIMLSDNDIMVYPLEEDKWQGVAEYINKIGKLKITTGVSMYVNGNLPLIFETKFGGNGITARYLIAPRIDSE